MELQVGPRKILISDTGLEMYLASTHGGSVAVKSVKKLGEGFHNAGFLLSFEVEGAERHLVMRVMRGDTGWGHDYLGDRAGSLLLQHQLLNSAPSGTPSRSVDVASIDSRGRIISVGDSVEFIHLVEEITEKHGTPYVDDFFRMAKERTHTERDLRRCRAAARYLASLHSNKHSDSILYRRHVRDLIGHGEMLMGVADTYPPFEELDFITPKEMEKIEVAAVRWRNRIKSMSHRLSRIHGDFHPFGNIRFDQQDSLVVSDFSREEFGEPADDVSSLTINYIFFSVWHFGEFKDPFKQLFREFFDTYMKESQDQDILNVIAPFYAFRGLVVIHPLYYPEMERAKRRMMLNFIHNSMSAETFELDKVEDYLTAEAN
ncbi:MAG: phosphotransferase [archaeon]